MKLTITNTFEVSRADGKPITGKLKSTLNYFNMYSFLALASGGTYDFNGYEFSGEFADGQLRVSVLTPLKERIELIFEA